MLNVCNFQMNLLLGYIKFKYTYTSSFRTFQAQQTCCRLQYRLRRRQSGHPLECPPLQTRSPLEEAGFELGAIFHPGPLKQ